MPIEINPLINKKAFYHHFKCLPILFFFGLFDREDDAASNTVNVSPFSKCLYYKYFGYTQAYRSDSSVG